MANRNGMGPFEQGPNTGRGFGPCGEEDANRTGRGYGCRLRRRVFFND